MEDYDDFDDEPFSDEFESAEQATELDDYAVESAGYLDGESDANLKMPRFGSYGSSIDLDALSDAQRDLYDNAYHSGHDAVIDDDL